MMAKDAKKTKGTVVEQTVDLSSDESRREFVTKLASAAGAIAAVGLISGVVGQKADAAEPATARMATTNAKTAAPLVPRGVAAIKTQNLENGFAMSLSGGDIGKALQREGLVKPGVSADKVAVKLELST